MFKYFSERRFAKSFLAKGDMLFRPLSYFQALEDEGVRGDAGEGSLSYAPVDGLRLNKSDGSIVEMPGWTFRSTAKRDDIFVFCASARLCPDIAERFQARFCVEVTDMERLCRYISARHHNSSALDYGQVYAEPVCYRQPTTEPGVDWALPDRIAFRKPESYAWQEEIRIALGKRGAFAPENVSCTIEAVSAVPQRGAELGLKLLPLRVGCIEEFARLHEF